MIDNFALAISHGLMMLAIWALLKRPDLDREPSPRDRPARDLPGETPGTGRGNGPGKGDRPVA